MSKVYYLSCFLSFFFVFVSCKQFKEPKLDDEVNEMGIDYTSVDSPPSFPNCEDYIDQNKINCFQVEMNLLIKKTLEDFEFTPEFNYDCVDLIVQINSQGIISLFQIIAEEPQQNLETFIKNKLKPLPIIKPAIKRGIPVTSQYVIPLCVNQL